MTGALKCHDWYGTWGTVPPTVEMPWYAMMQSWYLYQTPRCTLHPSTLASTLMIAPATELSDNNVTASPNRLLHHVTSMYHLCIHNFTILYITIYSLQPQMSGTWRAAVEVEKRFFSLDSWGFLLQHHSFGCSKRVGNSYKLAHTIHIPTSRKYTVWKLSSDKNCQWLVVNMWTTNNCEWGFWDTKSVLLHSSAQTLLHQLRLQDYEWRTKSSNPLQPPIFKSWKEAQMAINFTLAAKFLPWTAAIFNSTSEGWRLPSAAA